MLNAREVRNGGDLRQWRKERGWNQGQVAGMLFSSQKTISNIENKPYDPLPAKLQAALAAAENPAEAKVLGNWQHVFGQMLDHLQNHGLMPVIEAQVRGAIAAQLTRQLQDELHRAGVRLAFDEAKPADA